MMTSFGAEWMAKTRRYHPLVADDLATAVTYYDDISIALGNRFRAAVRDRIEAVTDRPESFGRIREECRAAMLDQFPYVVVFELQNQAVEILGVFHAASDQGKWFERSE